MKAFIACMVAYLVLWVVSPHCRAEEISFESLLIAAQANTDQLRTGEGQFTIEELGPFFTDSFEDIRQTISTFAFEEDKVRTDREFDYNRGSMKEAWSGGYHYLSFDEQHAEVPNAYIKKPRFLSPSAYINGQHVDLRRAMQTWQFSYDVLIREYQNGTLQGVTVQAQDDGTYLVFMPLEDDEYWFWFDPAQGFGVTREQYWSRGVLANQIKRSFLKIDDVWTLSGVEWDRYDREGNHSGKLTGKVELLQINHDIPDSQFDIRGFDLPPHTEVINTIDGLRFTLDPIARIDRAVYRLERLNEAHNINVAPLDTDDRNQVSHGLTDSTSGTEPGFLADSSDNLVRDAGADTRYLVIVLIGVGMLLCAGGFWIWRQNREEGSSRE